MHEKDSIHTNIFNEHDTRLPTPTVSILYLDYDNNVRKATPLHRHNYWQLIIVFEGMLKIVLKEKNHIMLSAGKIIIIPQETLHSVVYEYSNTVTWSIKFEAEKISTNLPVIIIPDTRQETEMFSRALLELFHNKKQISVKYMSGLEYLLGAILGVCQSESKRESTNPEWLLLTQERITEAQGKIISLAKLAGKVGYSRAHLSRLFKKFTGLGLKEFVDLERLNIAKKKMAYSGKNLNEIADEMGFPDIYGFSRFFKRMSNCTPSLYRKQMQKK